MIVTSGIEVYEHIGNICRNDDTIESWEKEEKKKFLERTERHSLALKRSS